MVSEAVRHAQADDHGPRARRRQHVTSGLTLLVACTVFAVYDYTTSRWRLVQDVAMLADIVGSNSTGALAFEDRRAAADTLRAMSVDSHVVSARLIASDGTLFGSYVQQQPGQDRQAAAETL
jgi:hypothetical protein